MEEQAAPAHVLMVSFPAQGHINPLLRLAKRMASKGLLVTFSSSSDIGHKISAATSSSITHRRIRFEFFSDGWEDDDPRPSNINDLISHLEAVGPPAVTDLIRQQSDAGRPVSFVITTQYIPWLLDVAEELSIPSAVLWAESCAVFSAYYHFHHKNAEFPTMENPDVSVTLPSIPEMKADELPTFLLPSERCNVMMEVIHQYFRNLEKATWVLANSFEELELDAIKAFVSPTLIPVGPLVEMEKEQGESVMGHLIQPDDCMEWLDDQQPRSVVYVSVGSIVLLSKADMEEMAHGLVDSGRPFLWVVRPSCQDSLPTWFLDDGKKKKGMVVGWCPQDRVLAHEAVGCFLTQCGWNSTLEAVASGVPVVAYPQWGDQVPNAKFLVDVWAVGARMRSPAERGEVARCIKAVVESEGMRKRAGEWKEAATRAVSAGGSSDRNIQKLVDEIVRRSRIEAA